MGVIWYEGEEREKKRGSEVIFAVQRLFCFGYRASPGISLGIFCRLASVS